jgi:ATP synthase protein I
VPPSLARTTVLPVVGVTAVAAAISFALAGPKGLLGAALGGLLVILFFGADHVLNARTGRTRASSVMALALGGYAVKIGLLAALLIALGDTTMFSTAAFGAAILAATVSWLALDVRAFLRRRILYVQPSAQPAVESIGNVGSTDEPSGGPVAPLMPAWMGDRHSTRQGSDEAV